MTATKSTKLVFLAVDRVDLTKIEEYILAGNATKVEVAEKANIDIVRFEKIIAMKECTEKEAEAIAKALGTLSSRLIAKKRKKILTINLKKDYKTSSRDDVRH